MMLNILPGQEGEPVSSCLIVSSGERVRDKEIFAEPNFILTKYSFIFRILAQLSVCCLSNGGLFAYWLFRSRKK